MRLFCLLLIITSPLFGVGSCSRLLPALDGCTIRGYTCATTVNAGVIFQIIKTSTGEVVSVWEDTDIVH